MSNSETSTDINIDIIDNKGKINTKISSKKIKKVKKMNKANNKNNKNMLLK